MNSRVWLAEVNTRYNIKGLKEYGEISYFNNGKQAINPIDLQAASEFFDNAVKQFDQENDYVCMTGHSLTTAIMLVAMVRRFEWFKILLFDARNGTYAERKFIGFPSAAVPA